MRASVEKVIAELGSVASLTVDSQVSFRRKERGDWQKREIKRFTARRAAETQAGFHAEDCDWGCWRQKSRKLFGKSALITPSKKHVRIKKKRGEKESGNWQRGFYFGSDGSVGKVSTSGSEGNHTDCWSRWSSKKKIIIIIRPVICDELGEDEWQLLII